MKESNFLDQILRYLFLKKKEKNVPKNIDLTFMHGMNRISIYMFLFAMCVIVYRLFFKR